MYIQCAEIYTGNERREFRTRTACHDLYHTCRCCSALVSVHCASHFYEESTIFVCSEKAHQDGTYVPCNENTWCSFFDDKFGRAVRFRAAVMTVLLQHDVSFVLLCALHDVE